MCDINLYKSIDWKIERIDPSRWYKDHSLSSGVGRQISKKLHSLGMRMYRSESNLTRHDGNISVMNTHKNISKGTDLIAIGIASIPSREYSLKITVDSLYDQADHINVFLNGYSNIPIFLKKDKITVYRSQSIQDFGDAGKFYGYEKHNGYYFSCDDDIIYPSNYVRTMINAIECSNRKAIVGLHGVVLNQNDFSSYYKSRRSLHFKRLVERNEFVNILGTGVCAMHTDTISLTMSDFPFPNMADIWLGAKANKMRVPMVCLSHEEGYMKTVSYTEEESIYSNSNGNTKSKKNTLDYQNKIIVKNMPWKISKT